MEVYRKQSVTKNNSDDELDMDHPAFVTPAALEDDDLSIPPMTGEQYLRRVIEEAKSLESITIADTTNILLKTECKYPELPAVKPCSNNLLPSKEWQLSAMADFSQLRLEMDKLREKIPLSKCSKLSKSLPHNDDEESWRKVWKSKFSGLQDPSTELCLALSQEKLCGLLNHFGNWITNGDVSVKDGCRWAYCLLACLQLPIESGIYFYLRQIARALINSRSLLENQDSVDLPHMNLLICIIGRYFNQTDLADPFV